MIISDAQGQLTPQSQARAWQNLKLIQAFMVVLVTDIIKKENARVVTTLNINSADGGRVGPKFKLIQALMVVLVTFKNEKYPF